MRILVTGAAGFVGFHLTRALLGRGHEVVGVDNMNDYYAVELKEARLAEIGAHERFQMNRLDLSDRAGTQALFRREGGAGPFDRVVHLAAQAGVRYSLDHPHEYVDSNLVATVNVLEGCRHGAVPHLLYASSSSVYGSNTEQPYAEHHRVDSPVSLYAATKRAGELMAQVYGHLHGVRSTGLRFFTVYGPWGRPDMAYFKFTEEILNGRPIDVFNGGQLERDFTFVDDVVVGLLHVLEASPPTDAQRSKIYNIGAGRPVGLLDFIEALERALGITAAKRFVEMQPGDVHSTWADTSALKRDFGYAPSIPVEEGVARFVDWYRRVWTNIATGNN